jgi:hypothetical protein
MKNKNKITSSRKKKKKPKNKQNNKQVWQSFGVKS